MTQATYRTISPHSPIHLQLTPMQLPIGQPNGDSAAAPWQQEGGETASQINLRLSPEEPSELLVQIYNQSDRNLRLAMRVTGDFPPQWCDVHTEGEWLPAQQGMDGVLYFRLPKDFFESHQALQPRQALKLNYRGRIQIYRLTEDTALNEDSSSNPELTERQNGPQSNQGSLISSADFQLNVRPHSLYPSFLPEIYQEVDFIGRFLAIFEQAFEPAVNQLQSLWAYLDPLTAPEGMLPFLAHWVGWPDDIHWGVDRQRRLIRQAMEIYQWRGTRKGLRLYLQLYTDLPDDQIQIIESFTQGFVLGGETSLGVTTLIGGGQPFHFTVRLQSHEPLEEALIRKIIDQEKPAFCTYDLDLLPLNSHPPPPAE